MIATITKDPTVYLALVKAYPPLARYVRTHMRSIIPHFTRTLVGNFRWNRSDKLFDAVAPVKHVSLDRNEIINCACELTYHLTKAKCQNRLNVEDYRKSTYQGEIQKVRYNVMPNDQVDPPIKQFNPPLSFDTESLKRIALRRID